jgi:hypothetical protein
VDAVVTGADLNATASVTTPLATADASVGVGSGTVSVSGSVDSPLASAGVEIGASGGGTGVGGGGSGGGGTGGGGTSGSGGGGTGGSGRGGTGGVTRGLTTATGTHSAGASLSHESLAGDTASAAAAAADSQRLADAAGDSHWAQPLVESPLLTVPAASATRDKAGMLGGGSVRVAALGPLRNPVAALARASVAASQASAVPDVGGEGGSRNVPPPPPGGPFNPLSVGSGSPGSGFGPLFAALTLLFLLATPYLGRRLRPAVSLGWSPAFLSLLEHPG